jgi:enoyl-CoA hydratase/carnithine racemase
MGNRHSGVTAAVAGPLATLTVSSAAADLADALCAARAELPGSVRVALLRIRGLAVDEDDRPPVALDADDDAVLARWQRAFDWYTSPAFVSIAAVAGAVGGQLLRLALGTDLRLLSEDARLVFAPPGSGQTVDHARLVTLAGAAKAIELSLVGATLDAAEARDAGLVNMVAHSGDLELVADRLCARLIGSDREAATEAKALLLNAISAPPAQHAAAERDALRRLRNARLGVERED